jgi:hypothetical protein
MSAFAAVVGIGMLIWGISAFSDFGAPSGGPGGGVFTGFVVLWALVIVGIIGFHVMNSLGKGPPAEVAEIEEVGGEAASAEARLRALEDLRNKGLISPAEYARKRSEILTSL